MPDGGGQEGKDGTIRGQEMEQSTRGRPIMIFQRRYRLLEDQKKPMPIKSADLKIYIFV